MSRTFATLVTTIAEADRAAASAAGRQAQQLLSLWAWLIGAWIVGFEQHGADRAAYGDRLIDRLAEALKDTDREGVSARNLLSCRQVAIAYPGLDVGVTTALIRWPEIPQTSTESASKAAAPVALPWRDARRLRRVFTAPTSSSSTKESK